MNGRLWRRQAAPLGLVALLLAMPACGDDDRGADTADVVSTATTCRALPNDPLFGGEAKFVSEINVGGGDTVGCTLVVASGSAVLEKLDVTASGCPPDAEVFLHFITEEGNGWRHDLQQLTEHNRDNGECHVEG